VHFSFWIDTSEKSGKGGGVSIRVMSEVWKHSRATGADLLVMLALADFSNDHGESFPSLRIIAQKARLTVRGVCKILDKREAAGEIRRNRSRGGKNRRTRYFIELLNSEQHSVNGIQRTAYSEPGDIQTVNGGSQAKNRHRTVSNSASRKKHERADSDPRVKTLFTTFQDKYVSRTGTPYALSSPGKDCALLKSLLTYDRDVPAIDAAMDRYFTDDFYSKTGFDVGGFVKSFNRLNSAGAKKRHNYEDGAFPSL
jgi:hypothetical protein